MEVTKQLVHNEKLNKKGKKLSDSKGEEQEEKHSRIC